MSTTILNSCRSCWRLIRATAFLACAVAALVAPQAVAAPGDLIGNVDLPVPGVGVSVAVDCEGTVYYTLDNDTNLYSMDKDGVLINTVDIGLAIDEMAWDDSRQVLWGQLHGSNPVDVYTIDAATGAPTFEFKSQTISLGSFRDGIAYDGSDDSLWLSGDVSTTVEHYQSDGTFINQITPKDDAGDDLGLISGVMVGIGDLLYLGRNGAIEIVQVKKSNGDFISSFTSPGGARDEGLECDATNFSTLALWSREFNAPGFISAIEIADGTCACGGGGDLLSKELTSGPDRDGTVWFEDFSSIDGLTLNGSAAQAVSALRLTPAAQGQAGSAFTTNPIALGPGGSFNTHFSFQISNSGNGGADGVAFLVQGAGANALGGGGGSMGYGGITPSLAVEFDSWDNGAPLGDPDGNHVGTGINGSVGSGAAVSLGAPSLDGGTVFYTWIDYDGVADMLEVRLATVNIRPAAATLSQAGIGLEALLGGTSAYVGFTSGTGAAFGNHDILSWHFSAPDLDGIDLVVPIGVLVPTAYDFTITWYGDTPVWIYDTVPAEWDITHIEFDDDGLPLDCGGETDFTGDYGMVEVWRGGKKGKNCQSDTDLRWMPGEDNTLNVQTLARCHDNKNNKKCKPTSCGALYLNYGAVAYQKDPDTNELVLDEDGNPIEVAGPTNSLCLAAVDDVNEDGEFTWDGSGDEDGDNLSDLEEACEFGTDPCLEDTDGDGVNDDVDVCPLRGDEGNGVDADGCPIVACTMVDNFDYQWNLLLEGDGTLAAGSTIELAVWAPEGGTASGSLNPEGGVALTATNLAGNGCAGESDEFNYAGNCSAGSCSGTWESFCPAGNPDGSGVWNGDFVGDCEISNPDAALAPVRLSGAPVSGTGTPGGVQ